MEKIYAAIGPRKRVLEAYCQALGLTEGELVRRALDAYFLEAAGVVAAIRQVTVGGNVGGDVGITVGGDSRFSPPPDPLPSPTVAVSKLHKAQKQKAPDSTPLVFPPSLDVPAFKEAWEDWHAYRRERRLSKWQSRTIVAKLKEFEKMGVQRAIAAIRNSISNGFQGVFEPKPGGDTRRFQDRPGKMLPTPGKYPKLEPVDEKDWV